MRISSEVLDQTRFMRHCRRALHWMPETGFELTQTRAYILETLAEMEPDRLEQMGGGIRAVFCSPLSPEKKKAAIGFRSDMDALQVEERTGLSFASRNPGFMHACGHDGHMAVLLALGRMLGQARDALKRDVALLFEPAEESVGGAQPMIEAGALKDPDLKHVFGLHLMPDIPLGKIGVKPGPMMASAVELDIDIEGKAVHGATPHLGADAVMAMAQIITGLECAMARCVDPFMPAVLTIGRVEAGQLRNVVADSAHLECTLRSFDGDLTQRALKMIQAAMDGADALYGTRSRMTQHTHYPPVINPPESTRLVMELLEDSLYPVEPRTIAEDFSNFQRATDAVFVFLGCGDDNRKAPLHASTFDFDERALMYGLELFVRLIDRVE